MSANVLVARDGSDQNFLESYGRTGDLRLRKEMLRRVRVRLFHALNEKKQSTDVESLTQEQRTKLSELISANDWTGVADMLSALDSRTREEVTDLLRGVIFGVMGNNVALAFESAIQSYVLTGEDARIESLVRQVVPESSLNQYGRFLEVLQQLLNGMRSSPQLVSVMVVTMLIGGIFLFNPEQGGVGAFDELPLGPIGDPVPVDLAFGLDTWNNSSWSLNEASPTDGHYRPGQLLRSSDSAFSQQDFVTDFRGSAFSRGRSDGAIIKHEVDASRNSLFTLDSANFRTGVVLLAGESGESWEFDSELTSYDQGGVSVFVFHSADNTKLVILDATRGTELEELTFTSVSAEVVAAALGRSSTYGMQSFYDVKEIINLWVENGQVYVQFTVHNPPAGNNLVNGDGMVARIPRVVIDAGELGARHADTEIENSQISFDDFDPNDVLAYLMQEGSSNNIELLAGNFKVQVGRDPENNLWGAFLVDDNGNTVALFHHGSDHQLRLLLTALASVDRVRIGDFSPANDELTELSEGTTANLFDEAIGFLHEGKSFIVRKDGKEIKCIAGDIFGSSYLVEVNGVVVGVMNPNYVDLLLQAML